MVPPLQFKSHLTLLLFFFILTTFSKLAAQTEAISNLEKNLELLRLELLKKEEQNAGSLLNTIHDWSTLEPDSTKLTYFLFNAQYFLIQERVNFKKFRKIALKKTEKSRLAKSVSKEELESLNSNKLLSLFLSCEIFDSKSPHNINISFYEDEIEFYDLQSNEKIADIGCGQGALSLLLQLTDLDLIIYSNEIKAYLIDYLNDILVENFSENKSINPILATEEKLNLPEPVDKIILRNTYHHFDQKDKMFEEIKKSLKKDGQILIKEGLKKEKKTKTDCNKKMEQEDILKEFQEAGFELIKQDKIEDNLYLKYKLPN